MNLKVTYFENIITFCNEMIQVIEIENKKIFYQFVNNLFYIKNEEKINDLYFYDNQNKEIDLTSKIEIYTNYFDLDINSKKNINTLSKVIVNTISESEKIELMKIYNKMYKSISNILKNIDLPIVINESINLEDIIKLSKINIKYTDNLLENILLVIDIERILKLNSILFFINLKQYLSKDELKELYKYAIYNNIKICLIDSQSYGVNIEYEKKLIIDSDLEEFVI